MFTRSWVRRGISRAAIVVIVVVIIIILAAGGFYAISSTKSISASSTLSTSSTSSSPSTISVISSSTSSSSSSQSSQKVINGTLVEDDAFWPVDDLNELYAVGELPWPNWLGYTVYQPLVGLNLAQEYQSGNIQLMPALAANWTASQNGSVFTFNLRNDVNFSDGNPFNAYQVWMEMYGFYYLSGNSSVWLESFDVFNMSTANFGPATIALINQSGLIDPSVQALAIMQNSSWPIYVTGPYQIVFHLDCSFASFPGLFVSAEGLMFDTQWLLDNGGFGTPTTYNPNFNLNPIPGSGAYVVTQVSENSYVAFKQSPNYWGKDLNSSEIQAQPIFDPGHVTNVIVYYKPDDLSRYTDLANGAAQIAGIEQSDWNLVTSNPSKFSFSVMPDWTGKVTVLSLNTQRYPTNITDFRLAIAHAVNYTDVTQKAFLGYAAPMMGPEYPAFKQFYDLGNYSQYSYNLTLAQQYLTESNVTSIPTLSFTIPSACESCTAIAEVVQSDLSEIGITVNIEVSQLSTYIEPYGPFATNLQNAQSIGHLSLVGGGQWAPSTASPFEYWLIFMSNQSAWGNWAIYSNPVVQSCVNSFLQTTNVSAIQAKCALAQTQIYNDAPYLWLGVNTLWYTDGSIVYLKGVVNSFYTDPVWQGETVLPIFNTVTFDPGVTTL